MSRRSAPAKLRRDVAQYRVEDVGAVVDTELIRDRQQQSVGGGNRLILGQLLDELLGLPGVCLAEARLAAINEPDLVLGVAFRSDERQGLPRFARPLVRVVRGPPRGGGYCRSAGFHRDRLG